MSVQTAIKPNRLQDNIIEFFANGTGNAVIEAVAGSGKTTTLLRMFDLVQPGQKLAYCVYNRANANEAKDKVGFRPGIFINTAHGFGSQAWKKAYPDCKVDKDKKWEMIATKLDLFVEDENGRRDYANPNQAEVIQKLIGFAKDSMFGRLVDPRNIANWEQIIEHHNLIECFAGRDGSLPVDVQALLLESCRKAYTGLMYSIELAPTIIDFNDMVYMPLIGKVKLWQYDFVFVDEAQDTNAARRELYKAMLKPNGRMIAVGDPHQAIYGFTGADFDSLDILRNEMHAITLPLNCSFRCPKSVVNVAKRYVQHIESHEDAPEGETRIIKVENLLKENLTADDYIVCRNTAPLVDLAYTLIRKNIPCHIQGKDIGDGLVKMSKMWKKVKTVGDFETKLIQYTKDQVTKLMDSGREAQAGVLQDKADTMLAICEDLAKDDSIATLQAKIASLFMDGDNSRPSLKLLTIHKSKGLEADRVFWLGANRYQPSPFAKKDWQLGQEINLCYVAATRAKKSLIEVVVPVKPIKKGYEY